MIKLSANVMKKLPVPGQEFSSRSYSAGIEVEVADGTNGQQLKEKLAALYALLEEAVDDQLRKESEDLALANGRGRANSEPREPKGRGNDRMATEAQLKAIKAIARDHRLSRTDLTDLMDREFGLAELDGLSLQQASRLIDVLKDDGKET